MNLEFQFDPSTLKSPREVFGSKDRSEALSNDRLKKAIERNKRKQVHPKSRQGHSTIEIQANERPTSYQEPSSQTWVIDGSENDPAFVAGKTRKSVARPGETYFSAPIEERKRLPAPIKYLGMGTSAVSHSKKRLLNLDWHAMLLKLTWALIVLMSLRLLISRGGVFDYYDTKEILTSKRHELEIIQKENHQLLQEIEEIKISSPYQKKIVRDHLGFISEDEYMIIFSRAPSGI